MIMCDNMCGAMYCSDSCAEVGHGHRCGDIFGICSFCNANFIKKYMILCRNECGAMYCSDSCAYTDHNHICGEYNIATPSVSDLSTRQGHFLQTIAQAACAVFSRITAIFH